MPPTPYTSKQKSIYSPIWRNKRIGLLGGSFNPPHEGHLHISKTALQALKLDYIWWLVTPQNPLKTSDGLKPYDERFNLCKKITASHPQIIISDVEQENNLTHSYDTLKQLHKHLPSTKFVWCTGMDNAHQFHLWYKWREILKTVATAHIARPPATSLIENCPLRMQSTQKHVFVNKSSAFPLNPEHSYWILEHKMNKLSSTQIRGKNL